MNRNQVHQMLDLVPESYLPRVVDFIRSITDPVQLAMDNAPYDDEPLSEEELAQMQQSEKELAAGELLSWEEAMAQLGIDPDAL